MRLLESTLREGEQRFGVYFTPQVKREIALGLISCGIEELEIGVVKPDEYLFNLWRSLKQAGFAERLSFWCRLKKEDILLAQSFVPSKLNLSIPVSNIQLKKRLHISCKDLLNKIVNLIKFAADKFPFISLGLEDASRAEKDFLWQAIDSAVQAGAKRIRLSDTLGRWTPLEVANLVREFKSRFQGVELAIHAHNDFGMATANAICALESGADWADVSILGLGERAGLARTEEVLAFLYFHRNAKRYNLKRLVELVHYVAWHAGVSIPEFKPIVGKKLFYCETGLHVEALYKNRKLYEPFPPEEVGLKHHFEIGAKSGRAAIASKLKELGFNISEQELDTIVKQVKIISREKGAPLSDNEVLSLVQKILAKNTCTVEEDLDLDFLTNLKI
ncbi:LeuA family protein [Thermodesulfatator atlanticus]|uniref:LeuA family protein n=1 Tax=Thermodesulfatator atlanticus TaxID=501497 RepID=UPI0003B60E3D|nr:pyruvate carboxyltransferase [Thermodesulfatator atlanticus]